MRNVSSHNLGTCDDAVSASSALGKTIVKPKRNVRPYGRRHKERIQQFANLETPKRLP